MRIAVPVWENRVSPVLDTAGRLLVVDTHDGIIDSRTVLDIGNKSLMEKAAEIKQHADVLICGALSRSMESYLLALGVEVFSWVMGNADSLIDEYIRGHIPGPELYMPGCRMHYNRQCMHRNRQRKHYGKGRIKS